MASFAAKTWMAVMICNRIKLGLAIILATAAAGAADVQTVIGRAPARPWTVRPSADLSSAALAAPYVKAAAQAVAMSGFAKTAIDHHFAAEATGSVGYLCGRQPGPHEDSGPASASGPEGT